MLRQVQVKESFVIILNIRPVCMIDCVATVWLFLQASGVFHQCFVVLVAGVSLAGAGQVEQ